MLLDVDIEKKLGDFNSCFSFNLEREQSGVFGPSGSGKSTLMNMLAGLVTPDRGHIRLKNKTLYDSSPRTNLPPQKRNPPQLTGMQTV